MDLQLFKQLFVHRDDSFAIQNKDGGSYTTQRRILTDQNIKDHLAGKQTIGLYQLKQETNETWTVKWACVDIDINKPVWSKTDFNIDDWVERLTEQAQLIKDKLKRYNIPSYIEDSAGKGRHVWIFFEKPVLVNKVKESLEKLLATIPLVDKDMHIELFPKQVSADYGNLVKAPLGRHMRTGKMSYFIEPLDDLEYATIQQLEHTFDPIESIFLQCRAFSDLRDKGLQTGHLTHIERLAMLYVFAKLPKGIEYYKEEILKKMKDWDPEIAQKHIDFALKKGYKPINCSTLQTSQHEFICKQQCRAIGGANSPITFYYRATGKKEEAHSNIDAVARSDAYHQIGFGYYWEPPKNAKSQTKVTISDFYYRQDEILEVDDGMKKRKIFKGALINEDGEHEFELAAEEWANKERLLAKIYACLGNNIIIDDIGKVRDAMGKFAEGKHTYVRKIFGYNDKLDHYYTPTLDITVDGITENDDVLVDLSGEGPAEFLDMRILTDEEFNFVKSLITEHLLHLLPTEITHASLAHALIPIIAPFLFKQADDSRYIFFLQGTSGAGKSFLMEKLQCLYGNFLYYGNWSGTPNSIQRIGYFFKDAMFLVDDFKRKNVSKHYNEALTIMQTYTDNAGRTRLGVDSSLQQTYRIQGWFSMAGEDHVEGEASNVARMVVIQVPSVALNIDSGNILSKNTHLLSGFTPRYIQWILQQDKEEMTNLLTEYHKFFHEPIKLRENGIRISRNIALLLLSFNYAARFIWPADEAEKNITKLKEFLSKLIFDMVDAAVQESSSDRFWNTLQELLAIGKVRFQSTESIDSDKDAKAPIIGFYHKNEIYLILNNAYTEVQKHLKIDIPLSHSSKAVASELHKKGVFLDKSTVVRKLNKKSVRVIRVNPAEFETLTGLNSGIR